MFGLFERKIPTMVGVDISSCSVKLMELSQGPQGFRVETYGVEPLPQEAMQEKEIKDIEAVGSAIERIIKRSKLQTKYAAVAVSGSSVITKVIQMNSGLSDNEMATQIQLEADRYIPYPLEEIYLDFQVLGPSHKNPDLVDVLLAASRSDNVDARVEALNIGGLTTKVVDIEAFAIERAIGATSKDGFTAKDNETIAVVDIGASMTTLSVIRNNMTIYTREQIFGGKQLTEEIQRRYGLTNEQAGYHKKHGGLPDDYAEHVLEPFKEGIVQQVSRSLQFFFSSSEYSSIDQIILAGGTSLIPNLTQKVEEKLGISAALALPITHMSASPQVNLALMQSENPALLVCCGLALRSFDVHSH